jgi:hypothetical protein
MQQLCFYRSRAHTTIERDKQVKSLAAKKKSCVHGALQRLNSLAPRPKEL